MMSRAALIIVTLFALAACNRDEFGSRAQGDSVSGDPTRATIDETNNLESVDAGQNNEPSPGATRAQVDLVAVTHNVGVSAYRAQISKGGNVVVSALGLTKSLSIASLGASSEGLNEFVSILGEDIDPVLLNEAVNEFEMGLDYGQGRSVLKVVPSVWAQRDAEFSQAFLDDLAYLHGLDIRLVDFESADTARLQINNWYRNQTSGYVTEVVAARGIAEQTRVAFIDSTYFSGEWATPFNSDLTRYAEFVGESGRSLPFMRRTDFCLAAQSEDWRAVVLPYVGTIALIAVLPREGAFQKVEDQLDVEFFRSVLDASTPQFVELSFPKVELGARLDSSSNAELGLNVANTQDVFTTIGQGLGAGTFLQRTKIRFSELGTTTEAGDPSLSDTMSANPLDFNRPFIFAIIDTSSNGLLYMGRMVR